MKARTRIAPSPTGFMHIGTLRTALFNYFLARQTGGEFILRIEDTDRERFVEGATESLITTFKKLGIEFDEGPFVQSERLEIYTKHAQELIEKGAAYYDFATKEQLETLRESQRSTKQRIKYDRSQAEFDVEKAQARIAAGEVAVIRLLVPEGETIVEDLIRGNVKFDNADIDDQVLIKSDGFPTYHLAVVVDDHLMNITHVIRGEEWLSSTPKHVLLYRAFGWNTPKFAHVPLLVNADRSKLSKRQGDVSVEDYLAKGYVTESLVNFVATLGYNPKADQEIYSVAELIELFDVSRVNKSGAALNIEKLNWMNNHYMKQLDKDELARRAQAFMDIPMNETLARAAVIEVQRAQTLVELAQKIQEYTALADYDSAILVWKNGTADDAAVQLKGMIDLLEGEGEFASAQEAEETIKSYIKKNELENGPVLWPLRVALSGKERSASPFELIWALRKAESLARIKVALERLSQ